VAQFALVAVVAVSWFLPPRWPETVDAAFAAFGAALSFIGVTLVFAAYRALGPAFTPLPRPPEGARLVEQGPYGVVRHPIYAGGILLFAGLALATSVTSLVATAALATLWAYKLEAEERWLEEKFELYPDYRRDTPWRLIPGVF
jgi:protein-S-isoprenylcysteine O-methyltransferase Ste14